MRRNPATDVTMVVFYDECDQEIHQLILYTFKLSVHIPPKKIEKGDLIEVIYDTDLLLFESTYMEV